MKCNHKGHILDHCVSLASALWLLGTRKDIGKRANEEEDVSRCWGMHANIVFQGCRMQGNLSWNQCCCFFFFEVSLVAGRSKDHRDSCSDEPKIHLTWQHASFRKTSLYFCVSSHLSLICVAPYLNLRLFYFIFLQEREIKGAHLILLSVEMIKHLTFCLEVWERGGCWDCWWGEVKLMQNYLFLSYSHDPLHPLAQFCEKKGVWEYISSIYWKIR